MGSESDGEPVNLDDLRARLTETDLIPSQQTLLDDVERRFALLDQAGVSSVAQLRQQLRSPNFAGALIAAGYRTADALAQADPQTLHAAMAKANDQATFYGGKVELRDTRRIVHAARYAPWTHRD